MDLVYSIPKYLTKVKMSSKKRVLVEGKDDKAHIKNLLDVISKGHKVRIDTAEYIKGDCEKTAKNNRAKIDKIHDFCKDSVSHNNLYYLCDREYYKFNIENQITDLMVEHESIGKLSWTLGHSIENYFFNSDILCEAYRFQCGSEYKSDAIELFKRNLHNSFKIVAAITLAAKDLGKSSYPAGKVKWDDFIIKNDVLYFDMEKWNCNDASEIAISFRALYSKYIEIVHSSEDLICSRISRGHTAMILLQRIFACCLYHVTEKDNKVKAAKDASNFSKIKEVNIASALCESWIRFAKDGKASYPINLIESVA